MKPYHSVQNITLLLTRYSSVAMKLLCLALLSLGSLSCAAYHTLNGITDYRQLELQRGDSVIITTKDNEQVRMSIKKSDADYFYGEDDNKKVKKDNIQSMELSRFYPGKIYFSLIGMLLLSFFFSG